MLSWFRALNRMTVLGAVFVFLGSFMVYWLTIAPTVSFWDCGEFIACSYILGVPHPPGAPLFVLIGRLFTLLPFFDQIALRTNLLSALGSACSVVVAYLIILKLVSRWNISNLARFLGAIAGGLFLGFTGTFWANAVETEVYGVGMFVMLLLVYLSLIWMEKKGTVAGEKLLILIAYLALLSIGIHMTVFIVMPALFLLILWDDKEKSKDFRFWLSGIVLGLVMFSLVPFLVGLLVWLALSLIGMVVSGYDRRWVLAFAIVLAGFLGYSVQLYVPIRSTQNPSIDENDPEDIRRFKYFLERKQYGQTSMVARAMARRGSWENQFGTHERMGFWGFFREQYSNPKIWYIPILLGLYGIIYLIKRRPREGIILLLLFLIASAGLVFYINFSDGTRGDALEVRERDYFFLPAFVFFAIFIGLGITALMHQLKVKLETLREKLWLYRGLLYALALILFLLPGLALSHNYYKNSRWGNWIPWDYAYNLLNSCDKNAIMFTNGDNDTFPLWFLQNVDKIRTDVRIVNLSLLNTDWYILQLKNRWEVPISLTDKQIKWESITIQQGISGERPREPYFDPVRNLSHFLFPFRDEKSGRIVRVQDMMVENIILSNEWKYPVYFSSTVSQDNRLNLDPHLKLEGYAWRLVPEQGERMIDSDLFYQRLTQVYQYRGLNDYRVIKDENTSGLLVNYPEKFIELANYYVGNADTTRAVELLNKSKEIYPDYWRTYIVLSGIYSSQNKTDQKDKLLAEGESHLKKMLDFNPHNHTYAQYLGLLLQMQNKGEDAIPHLVRSYKMSPSNIISYRSLLSIYISKNRIQEAASLVESWLENNPTDQFSLNLLQQLRAPRPVSTFPGQ
ncbi:MAG: hypothetical protein A2145_00455 [candidate division Zixibacteria bacterium RBG_16_40_9]|nr:MAG: hypothetical protein A2145_00455 [candidate division Zixibacteria bacterium RBG_16_40_9]